jgi:hypothetical protein
MRAALRSSAQAMAGRPSKHARRLERGEPSKLAQRLLAPGELRSGGSRVPAVRLLALT